MDGLSDLGQAAVRYAGLGLHVFPCVPGSKEPETLNGHRDATCDPDAVRRFWEANPNANIGLSLKASGLVCADADLYKEECQWDQLCANREIPRTWVQDSPRGGRHYIFRAVEGVEYGGNIYKGVDIKWNGYILLAPSTAEGKEYVTVEGRYLASAPDWLPQRAPHAPVPSVNPHKRHQDRSAELYGFYRDRWRKGWTVEEIVSACMAAPEATGADRFNGDVEALRKDVLRVLGKPDAREAAIEHGSKLWENCTHVGGIPKAALLGSTALFEVQRVTGTEETAVMEHYIDPWLPKGIVVGVYGRGESGKSSWVSTMVAQASAQVSTLWVSSEEDMDHIAVRYAKSGGEANAMFTLAGTPKVAGSDKVVVFDVYEHLERTIEDYRKLTRADRPLGVVVLDAINALVTWKKGESANDDGSVKRLIAHLHSLAGRYGITIVIIGHMNKNPKTEHAADAVTGSLSWTSSVRKAFLFYKDKASESDYDFFVRTAKANTGTHFAASYRTVPVHVIHRRQDIEGAKDEVLCKIEFTSPIVWGEKDIAGMINDSPEDDPNHTAKEKRKSKEAARIDLITEAIKAGHRTRHEIIAYASTVGVKLYGYHFDGRCEEALKARGVRIEAQAHGKLLYRL